jgi:hypothetical protein
VSEFAARISRVRPKRGGDFHILPARLERDDDGDNWRGRLLTHAREIAEDTDELVGFCIIGIYSDGLVRTGFRWDPAKCVIPRTLMPAWVGEILRRELITDPEARDVFNEMFEWKEGPTG